MTAMRPSTWRRLAGWLLGGVLLGAALPKLLDPPGFAQALHGFSLLPEAFLNPMALVLPWLEALLGLALVAGLARRSAAWIALVLMLAFSGALGWNLAHGRAIDCGCFGTGKPRTEAQRLLDMKWGLSRNALLASLALLLVLPSRRPQ